MKEFGLFRLMMITILCIVVVSCAEEGAAIRVEDDTPDSSTSTNSAPNAKDVAVSDTGGPVKDDVKGRFDSFAEDGGNI